MAPVAGGTEALNQGCPGLQQPTDYLGSWIQTQAKLKVKVKVKVKEEKEKEGRSKGEEKEKEKKV